MLRKLLAFVSKRVFIVALLIFIQLCIIVVAALFLSEYRIYYKIVLIAISILCVLIILNSKSNDAYKMAWAIPIIVWPVFGGLFYLIFGGHALAKRKQMKMNIITERAAAAAKDSQAVQKRIAAADEHASKQAVYIDRYAFSPPFSGTETVYLPSGEAKLQTLLPELEKARHFIFLEYFIINEGEMWRQIIDVLIRKVKEGVDVRLIYDDFGSINYLPIRYPEYLKQVGIKCYRFNTFRPVLNPRLNNRDHRKICVIDGHVGFIGGINFSDEYINKKQRCGYWKDTALMLKGAAVYNLTAMFLGMWEYVSGEHDAPEKFRPELYADRAYRDDGYVQPYSDNPTDDEPVGANVYLNMISAAKKYLYITTPYLIIDSEMTTALCNCAKSGVDVRIITPHIPDKKMIFELTRSSYKVLMESGVKIYEFTPGFVHAKMFVSDDVYATVGSVNLDYRSLYLHFECGAWLYGCSAIADIKRDFLETMRQSEEIREDTFRISAPRRLFRSLLRAFAPLL